MGLVSPSSAPSLGSLQSATSGGFAEAGPKGLTVLAEHATSLNDLKAEDIAGQIKDAEEDLSDASDDEARARAAATLSHLRVVQAALKAA